MSNYLCVWASFVLVLADAKPGFLAVCRNTAVAPHLVYVHVRHFAVARRLVARRSAVACRSAARRDVPAAAATPDLALEPVAAAP